MEKTISVKISSKYGHQRAVFFLMTHLATLFTCRILMFHLMTINSSHHLKSQDCMFHTWAKCTRSRKLKVIVSGEHTESKFSVNVCRFYNSSCVASKTNCVSYTGFHDITTSGGHFWNFFRWMLFPILLLNIHKASHYSVEWEANSQPKSLFDAFFYTKNVYR